MGYFKFLLKPRVIFSGIFTFLVVKYFPTTLKLIGNFLIFLNIILLAVLVVFIIIYLILAIWFNHWNFAKWD